MQKNTLFKIFSYYREAVRPIARSGIIAMIAYAIAFSITEIIRPLGVKYIIDGSVEKTLTPWVAVGIFLLITISYNVFFRIADFSVALFQSKATKRILDMNLQKIFNHAPSFFLNTQSGGLITKSKRYTKSFETMYDEFTYRISIMSIYIIGVTGIALLTDYRLGLIVIAFILIFSFIAIKSFRKKFILEKDLSQKDSRVGSNLSDIFNNIQTINFFGKHRDEFERFQKTSSNYENAFIAAETFSNKIRVIKGIIVLIFDTVMIGVLCYLFQKDSISIGTMYLFISYAFQISGAIWTLDDAIKRLTRAFADAQETVEIFEKPITLKSFAQKANGVVPSICIEDVSFSYGNQKNIFNGLSIKIAPGEKIGICGSTGSGKTTLVNLILRTMDPCEGSITIGGYSIKTDFSRDGLKKYISYVPQNIDLFNRTIMENIRFANASASDEEVISAAKRACIHDFITNCPNGYKTLVGERGLKLSGGQRQRIAIARALLCNSPILILDEATSALDSITETEILQILEKEFANKTVLVIAHRLSTIRGMDRIIVLEHGRIVEDGNHEALMVNNSYYARLIAMQHNGLIPG